MDDDAVFLSSDFVSAQSQVAADTKVYFMINNTVISFQTVAFGPRYQA